MIPGYKLLMRCCLFILLIRLPAFVWLCAANNLDAALRQKQQRQCCYSIKIMRAEQDCHMR